ncbi:amidase [Raphidocelis subcapitata]|uniref:Amidase n=1 Tax=Raphidocelis subcapitata TaxID=307507 RepID=A0A2V0PIB5_9CHLO|nr:amidase [Raphidocelis subcapitata]|eukprot:GBF97640.1 amidase [Raphidocelis subcapitata]
MAATGAGAAQARPDPTGSFILQFEVPGAPRGPLAGKTVAVKDLFDVKGYPTGFGNPTWLETHPDPAPANAPAVQALLDAGATLVGKTHMDELAYSLNGENAHYGTPANAAAPGRIPGGSSSGSAAAVAGGQADIGLGSDTGGSVRVPASYCGLWGIRPTHGRASLAAAAPLAPSFDTVGWFARDAAALRAAGGALLPPAGARPLPAPPRWLVAEDAFELALPETSAAIYQRLSGPAFEGVVAALGRPADVKIGEVEGAPDLAGLKAWMGVFRITQGWEVWRCHGEWLRAANPQLGPGIKDRFEWASTITQEQWAAADAQRKKIRDHMTALLGADGVLALPTAPGPAVPRGMPGAELEDWRTRLLSLTCVAGLSGLPQVNIPLARVDGLPVGLSLIGPAGSDEALMALAERVAAVAEAGAAAAGAAEPAAAAGAAP